MSFPIAVPEAGSYAVSRHDRCFVCVSSSTLHSRAHGELLPIWRALVKNGVNEKSATAGAS